LWLLLGLLWLPGLRLRLWLLLWLLLVVLVVVVVVERVGSAGTGRQAGMHTDVSIAGHAQGRKGILG